MKKSISVILSIAVFNLVFLSCERHKDEPPELPLLASMTIDFSDFLQNQKSAVDDLKAAEDATSNNYGFAALNVGVFSLFLGVVLAVPTSAFWNSFSVDPVFVGEATWEWTKEYTAFAASYTSRLTGQVRANDVKWEMYISKAGIGGFDEFKWYEGTSDLDGNAGQWILNYDNEHPVPVLQIDWEREGEEIGVITFTNIMEETLEGEPNDEYGSYIEAGKIVGDLDAYYDIYMADTGYDVDIEWSTTEYNGQVMCLAWFQDSDWHCWDGDGYDIDCE